MFKKVKWIKLEGESVDYLHAYVNKNWRQLRCQDLYKIKTLIVNKTKSNEVLADKLVDCDIVKMAVEVTGRQVGTRLTKKSWNYFVDRLEEGVHYKARSRAQKIAKAR